MAKTNLPPKHFSKISDFSQEQLERVLALAFDLKKNPEKYHDALQQKTLVMWFEKASVRTRLSFEAGMTQLGGHAIYMDARTSHGSKASIKDEIKVASRYADIIMARVFDHQTILDMMVASEVPVINGLCNLYHPCQALADVMTIKEFVGDNPTVAYIGDGNNVCNSLIDACRLLGITIRVATPEGFQPQSTPDFLTTDPAAAVQGADVVYTDTWVSMGDEAEQAQRETIFAPYQVDETLLGDRYFMHDLPATRGKEVTDAVMDSTKSLIFDQAENRLHAQKAIMLTLLS